MEDTNKYPVLDRLSSGALFFLGFLLPLFFLPVQGISIEVSKGILIGAVAVVAFSLWLLGRLVDGRFDIPKSLVLLSAFALGVIILLASIFSDAPAVSFLGSGFETDTFAFFGVSFVLLFLSSVFFQSKEKALYFYGALLASAAAVALFHVIRLFTGPETLSFGVFNAAASSIVGRWNDLSIFFGLIALLSLFAAELLSLTRRMRLFLYGVIAVSLFFVALINFSLNWAVLGVISLLLVCYSVYANREEPKGPTITVRSAKLPVVSLIVAALSLVFFLSSSSLGAYLSNQLNVSQLEVRPSFSATLEIATASLKKNAVFGAGPNRFSTEWLLNKPAGINESIFWNTDFNSGFGIIPDSLVTSGIAGFAGWIVFLSLFLFAGFRAMFNFSLSRLGRFLAVSSFALATYLWAFIALYVPGSMLYVLAFIFTGILIASIAAEDPAGRYSISLLGEPKLGFMSVIVLVFLLIGSLSVGYLYGEKFTAFAYFQKSLATLNNEGNIERTESYLSRAVKLSDQDIYYRALSELELIKLNNLLNETSLPQDTLRTQFQTLLGSAIESAKKATTLDKSNYGNFISLGRVYESIVPLKIPGAYESARDSYNQALALNPESPAIYLTLARLEVGNGNVKAGREYIDKALEKKQNYTEAVFYLSQLEAREGNTREAIRRTEEASLLAPNDITVFFQLGFLKYNERDNTGAISAFERAIALSPNYSNAKYFLGLTYYRVDRTADAIAQFEDVAALNPDNQEVKNILANLRAGRSPFADVPPPNNAPEKRPKPPIEE